MRKYWKLGFGLAMLVLLCPNAAVAQSDDENLEGQTRYAVTDLGALGGKNSFPNGINNRGQVVGVAETPDTDPNCGCPVVHAFVWRKGFLQDLGTLGGRNSGASAVNPNGQVVGFAEIPTIDPNFPPFLEYRAFLWEKGVMTDLGTVGGNDSGANAIDSELRVVGGAQTGQPDPFFGQQFHPFLWEKGAMIDLGTLGGSSGFAAGINELGQVVGGANADNIVVPPFGGPPFFAFLWENGAMRNLGALGGIESLAWAINDRAHMAGEFTFLDRNGNGISHAFLWEKGQMRDLGTVPGDSSSQAFALNNEGQVVGSSGSGFIDNFAPAHAFVWQHGSMTDLNSLIPANTGLQLIWASGINARGQIVAWGVDTGGNVHAILLTPADDANSSSSAATAAQAEAMVRPQVSLSENARRLLRLATPGGHRLKPRLTRPN